MSDQPDPIAIAALAAEHGLSVDPASIRFNEIGLDFRVGFAAAADGSAWVLRLPRRPDVVPKAQLERRILDLVRPHLPVAVPDWQIFSDRLIAYPLLAGEPGLTFDPQTYEVTWHFDQTTPLFPQTLAPAIATLHAIDIAAARAAGLPVFTPAEVRAKWRADLDQVQTRFEIPLGQWTIWQDWLADDSYWPDFSVPIHGDLYVGHVMVEPDGRAIGILDWTEARVGDPAMDLVGHLKAFDEAALLTLIEHYAAAGGRTWPRLLEHCHMLHSAAPVAYAIFALISGDADHHAAAQTQLSALA